jgi:DNA-binding CsgD family transcriptional regulator
MTKRGRPRHPDVLTPREWEVLSLIRDGLTNEQIAERMGVTIHAARYHVSQILSKLGVATREEAAAWQPEEVRAGPRWSVAFQVWLTAAAAIAVIAVGALAWGVTRGSGDDADAKPSSTASASASANPTATPVPDTALPASNDRSMQLIDRGTGWVLTDAGLYYLSLVPEDCVKTPCKIELSAPRDITPNGLAPFQIKGVHFFDTEHGWIVANMPAPVLTQLVVYRTSDAGENWEQFTFNSQADYSQTRPQPAYLDFIDGDHGWLVIDLQQTANSLPGELWRTADGGETWQKLDIPAGREARFFNENDGWLVGGVVNDRLYVTHDGGETWADASDIMPAAEWAGTPAFSLPTSTFEGQSIVLPVTLAIDPGPSLFMLFFSTDGGTTWPTHVSTEITSNFGVGVFAPSVVFDHSNAIAFAPDGIGLRFDGGKQDFTTFTPADVTHISQIDFADSRRGWALVETNFCPEAKDGCYSSLDTYLAQTDDGGQTWTSVTRPDTPTPAPTP